MPRPKKTPTKVTPKRGRRGFMPKKHKDPEFLTMDLHAKHTRGGKIYGPGANIQVPFDFAREFRYEEQCGKEADERFLGTRAAIVLRGNRVRQVPVEAFDAGLVDEFNNPSHRTG